MAGINRLDIKQLRILQLLLQQRNLSKVANLMGLTQQAISEQLRKLRDTFNDELFIRTNNGVIPTQFAENMEHKINHILLDIEQLINPEDFDPSSLTGMLQISTSDYALTTVLPQLLKTVNKQAPNLKIVIRDFESDNLEQLMVTGELDLVITFPEFIPNTFTTLKLFDDQHICVTGNNSPYAHKKFTLKKLAGLPQVIVSPSRPNLKGSHDAWFAKKGLTRNVIMSVPSFATAADIIQSTNTIAFLPSRILPDPKLIPIDLHELPPSFEVIAAWHPRSDTSPTHKWLLDILRTEFCSLN